jgi:hypothetical protein
MQLIKNAKNWTYNADSLEHFLAAIRAREAIPSSGCWNCSSKRGTEKFTGTRDLAHALDLATNGWAEGAARILKGQADIHAACGLPDLTPSFEWDIGGEFPDVGAFCAGVPEHMASPAPFNNSVASVVRIAIPGSTPSWMQARDLVTYGVALMSVIDSIQESGRSVALFWDMTVKMQGNNLPLHTVVPLTTAGAPVDVSRIAFAFHPSMLRRCWFATVELLDDLGVTGEVYGIASGRRARELWEHGTIYPQGAWGLLDAGELDSVAAAVRALTKDINSQLFGDYAA